MSPPPQLLLANGPVEELALTVTWLPEEGPAGILSVKQPLVVVLLLTSILLLLVAELTLFTFTSALRVGETSRRELSKGAWGDFVKSYPSSPHLAKALVESLP